MSGGSAGPSLGRFGLLREQREAERLALREVRLGDARARARTRPMKRCRSVTPIAPRASSTLNWCAAFTTKSYAGRTSVFSRGVLRRQREQALGLRLAVIERGEVRRHVGLLEVVRRPLPLGALVDLAVAARRASYSRS